MPKKKPAKHIPLYEVQVLDPAPNPMFSEKQTLITKFLHYTQPVKCAHCGKLRRRHWTQLRFFRVCDLGQFAIKPAKEIFPPLTPVCTNHLLAAIFPRA